MCQLLVIKLIIFVQYGVVNFLKNPSQQTPHTFPIRARYGVSFVGWNFDSYFASISLQWCIRDNSDENSAWKKIPICSFLWAIFLCPKDLFVANYNLCIINVAFLPGKISHPALDGWYFIRNDGQYAPCPPPNSSAISLPQQTIWTRARPNFKSLKSHINWDKYSYSCKSMKRESPGGL